MSISLSKWPMLPTIALCFIRAMWSAAMTRGCRSAVTKMSPIDDDVLERRDLVASTAAGSAQIDSIGHEHARALTAVVD